jgi:hypothetical protein
MATDNKNKFGQGGPKITGLDIFKNVGAALLIAFLVYWLPILAEQFYSPAEIRYRYVTLGNNSGYLFSIQNYSLHPIDEVSIYIDAPKGIGNVLYDGAISIETSTSKRLRDYTEMEFIEILEESERKRADGRDTNRGADEK